MSSVPAPDASMTLAPGQEQRLKRLLSYCQLDDRHLELVRELSGATGHGTELCDGLTAHVAAHPELLAIVEEHSTVERLMGKLAAFFASMFEGRYDDAQIAYRRHIGEVHDRIDLPLGAYLGAILELDKVVFRHAIERFGDDPGRLLEALLAYRHVQQADATIVAQSFVDARESESVRLQQALVSTTEQGRSSMGRTERVAEQMGDAVAAVREQLEQLRTQSRAILDTVEEVTAIASRLRLLSLNARIEAARAGEYGRGFEVVAAEVGELAESTNGSLEGIARLNAAATAAIAATEAAVDVAATRAQEMRDEAQTTAETLHQADALISDIAARLNGTRS